MQPADASNSDVFIVSLKPR